MCKHCERNDCPDILNEYWCTVHIPITISRAGKSIRVVTLQEESKRLDVDIGKLINENFWDLLGE